MQIIPYLHFDGHCRQAFTFYADCLGGTIEMMQTHGDSPIAAEVPPDWHDRVMHARLTAGGSVLMGSDLPPHDYQRPQNIHVSLQVEDPGEADRIFARLSESGKVTMPIDQTFWAARFGMLVDRYGIPWMVNCTQPS